MSQPAPIPDDTHASAGPFENVGKPAPREAGIANAKRRLLMVTRLSDLAMTVTEAVAERAIAEEAAAKAEALGLLAAAEAEKDEEAPVASHTASSQTAPAVGQTRVRARAESGATRRTPALRAADLFARLCGIVRKCLELEIRIEEDLRRLEAAPFAVDDLGARQRDQIQDAGRNGVGAMVETVIDETAETPAGNPRTLRRAQRTLQRRRRRQPPPRPG